MDSEVKKYVLEHLTTKDGKKVHTHANQKIKIVPEHIQSAIMATEGDTLRDKLLFYIVGPLHCETCGKRILPYPKFLGAAHFYCSKDCGHNSPTKMQNLQRPEFIQHRIKKQVNKHGCLAMNQPHVREKVKKNSLEKYGVELPCLSNEAKAKVKQTNLEKYGHECTLCSPIIRQKIKQTMQEKYGGHVMKTDHGKNKVYDTCFDKYAHEIFGDLLDKYGFDYVKSLRLPVSFSSRGIYPKEYLECLINGEKPSMRILERFDDPYKQVKKFYPEVFENGNRFEQRIKDILDSLSVEYKFNDRSVITPLELDFYLPDYNLAIECNGVYWHSDRFKDRYYHSMKTQKCHTRGIRLIHIWEWETDDIVISMLKSRLGLSQKISARKTECKVIDSKTANEFFKENHPQGARPSQYNYGLFHDDELVMCANFGKSRFNKNYDWELLRIASKKGINVVGGTGKLINAFRKAHTGRIVSYSDVSKGYNTTLAKIGFKAVNITKPGYWWVQYDTGVVLTRYQTQKHKLEKLLGKNYNSDESETQNMMRNGFYKVYDCGQEVFVLE